jgi:CspA family cold shock protein
MMRGRVRFWNGDKAFGWIEAADGRVFFVHAEEVVYRAPLIAGQHVTFQAREAPRGPRATAVQLLKPVSERR